MVSTRWVAVCLAMVLPGAPAAADERPAVSLRVHNPAAVAPHDLSRAQRDVERIFADAGVRLAWDDETAARRVTLWLVNIERDSKAGARDCALGLGVASTSTAYVFVNRLLAATHDRPVDRAVALAHAIAHEIGHVLLPPGRHARYGLMRGDLDFGVQNPPRFTREEAQALRARLAQAAPAAVSAAKF